MDISRHKICLDTFIIGTPNMDKGE
jgi:hypothetical protein